MRSWLAASPPCCVWERPLPPSCSSSAQPLRIPMPAWPGRSSWTVLLAGGCGLLVVLPIIRLVMMAGHFARHAERHFTAITLTVLALILIGGAAGLVL